MMAEELDSLAIHLAQELIRGTKNCADVLQQLQNLSGVSSRCVDLVHFLYHYATDEDIRERDAGYASWQLAQLRQLLAEALTDR